MQSRPLKNRKGKKKKWKSSVNLFRFANLNPDTLLYPQHLLCHFK